MEIDILDSKLIYLLGKNSRLSHASLARTLNTSREVVNFRLNRLKKKKFLLGTGANINYHLLGLHHLEILIRVRGASEETLSQLEKFLIDHKSFTNVQKTFGRWDYLVRARATDMHNITELLDEIATTFRDVIHMESFMILEENGPGWGAVIPKSVKQPVVPKDRIAFTHHFPFREKKKNISLDDVDKKILSILSENARANILNIADEAGVTHNTIIKKISRMIKEGAIESFDVKGSVQALGLSRKAVLLKVANIRENSKKADAFFNSMRECSRFWRFTGPTHYQLNLNVKTTEEFEKLLRKIRKFFSSDLLEIESLDVFEQIKRGGFSDIL